MPPPPTRQHLFLLAVTMDLETAPRFKDVPAGPKA